LYTASLDIATPESEKTVFILDARATRGEQRFAGLTYSQIARWTGLTLHTVRSYASRGQFDPRDIDSVLSWVNVRRASRGLPLIGAPDRPIDSPAPPAPIAPNGGYNPLTGEFD